MLNNPFGQKTNRTHEQGTETQRDVYVHTLFPVAFGVPIVVWLFSCQKLSSPYVVFPFHTTLLAIRIKISRPAAIYQSECDCEPYDYTSNSH